MKKIHIVNVGSAHANQVEKYGDFEVWAKRALTEQGIDESCITYHNGIDFPLPDYEQLAAVIIMGSLSMVTEKTDWMLRLSEQIRELIDNRTPLLGICFGHQLIAQAAGGIVDFHPSGLEAGTVEIQLLPEKSADPIFNAFPTEFSAHAVHFQSVRHLPQTATLLAKNTHEAHHAFRIGESCWGVQFHPEFTTDIMKDSLLHLKQELGDSYISTLNKVRETNIARQVLLNFAHYALPHKHNTGSSQSPHT